MENLIYRRERRERRELLLTAENAENAENCIFRGTARAATPSTREVSQSKENWAGDCRSFAGEMPSAFSASSSVKKQFSACSLVAC